MYSLQGGTVPGVYVSAGGNGMRGRETAHLEHVYRLVLLMNLVI